MNQRKRVWTLILVGLLALICIDRAAWADVAQWREDQSANLWLGYTQNPLDLPVGMISSVGIPNPNGMPLLGALLSRLPNLWAVSLALGAAQGALILWAAWLIAGPSPLFFLLSLPGLASVVLGATSVEFWNQWMMTSLNLLFFVLWVEYLRRPSPWKIVLLFVPILLAPALYLAGLVNAVLYFGFTLLAVWFRRPSAVRTTWVFAALAGLGLIVLALWLTWVPYARAVAGSSLPGGLPGLAIIRERLLHSLQSGLDFPVWNFLQWGQNSADTFYQNSPFILDRAAVLLLRLSRFLQAGQAVLLLTSLAIAIASWNLKRRPFPNFWIEGRAVQGKVALAGLAFVILAYMLSPLLGGPYWANGERMDQQVQFLPLLLIAWFTVPFALRLPARLQRISRGLTVFVAAAFVLVSAVNSAQIIRLHLTYRGNFLSEADVPLADKLHAVDFIAHDWASASTQKQVPVAYDLGGKKWDWVPGQGKNLERWYPAPFTLGRALDFELLRVYGLRNTQEGIQLRSLQPVRYVVSYAFLNEPDPPGLRLVHHRFGRLRVSVRQ